MSTVPPTAADIDSWATAGSFGTGNSLTWELMNAELLWTGGGHSNIPFTGFVVGYTQNDTTQQIIQLEGDPTSDQGSAWTCWALLGAYGDILVREYVLNISNNIAVDSTQTLNVVANNTEQTRVNDSANWVQFP